MIQVQNLPPQQLPFNQKGKEWRKKHLDWADNRTFFNDGTIRKSVLSKKINYDLVNGIMNEEDMQMILNPESIRAGFIPSKIQHYPIMNSKLNVLRGEEAKRRFDYRVIITNPNAISEIETQKKELIFSQLQQLVADQSLSEEEYNNELEKINQYYTYEYQDLREIRANALVNHYVKELNIPQIFNNGFMDAMTVGEEIYQCDIIGGEPTIERINPMKIRAFKSGFSDRIEDADIIILEDFWSPGRIVDTFYNELTSKEMKYIEELPSKSEGDSMDNIDERNAFIRREDVFGDDGIVIDNFISFLGTNSKGAYHDSNGNIKVIRVYWKSRRKIKKVKSYDLETGEEVINFYPENYKINKDLGEEETILWINEAWEGTKIGKEIYVNMRPRQIQYNRMSNPSRCHFGIVGSIYSFNENKPFSLVDMMKPYNYMYDAIHDRLNKAIAANWGKLVRLDLARVPKGWTVEKWMHYAKISHIAVEDSFNEGNYGASTGKLAGGLNNATSGTIDAETGNYIQQHTNLLEFIKMEMAEAAGITKQREGQISNRETVGGVERATLQSSHITEWLFTKHEDIKKRAIECFLETAKIAMKGTNKKFQYILPDHSFRLMEIEGDEFAECDYGLIVDNSPYAQDLAAKLDVLAQAALQNQTLSFSTIMKIYTNSSLAEIQRIIEKDEQDINERNAQNEEANRQAQMEAVQIEAEQKELDREEKREASIRDNQTKLLIAEMNALAKNDTSEDIEYSPEKREELLEKIRQFDEKLRFDKKVHEDKMVREDKKISKINTNKIKTK